MDLESQEWVESRILGDLEVEVEGERWVYDVEAGGKEGKTKRGEWRRRRWTRSVKRAPVRAEGAQVQSVKRGSGG